MISLIRFTVHQAERLNDPTNTVDAAERIVQHGQQVDSREPCVGISILYAHMAADLAGMLVPSGNAGTSPDR